MVLRVDVVAAALDAAYADNPPRRVIALSPRAPLSQELVEELAGERHLALLSARYEGFDERIVEHLCSEAISIGPYVLSNGDLPAMVVLDAIARRLPGALAEASGETESFSAELEEGMLEYPQYTRPPDSRLARSRHPPVGRPRPNRSLAEGACPLRNPIDRLTVGLPNSVRVTIDWLVTILGAILIVLAVKQWVINPYRIPSSSMEPTLNCARPGLGCLAAGGLFSGSDRVLACRICYELGSPKRGDIVVFNTPPKALIACGTGGVYVKRLIGLPGEIWSEKNGYVYINGKKLNEPYIKPEYRDDFTYPPRKIPAGQYFMMGDNRAGSCDSRKWGTVPRANLIGKVVATYWPPSRLSIEALFGWL